MTQPQKRKKIGLALSGGGARGFAHIGVLRVLSEHGIPIDAIAGTSAGSIVGAAFAAGMSPAEIEAMSARVGWTKFTRPSLSPMGLLSSAPMGQFIRREFPALRFEHLSIPFAAVATDLGTGREVVLSAKGDLTYAIRVSCAVPGVFVPIKDESGRLLFDGGAVAPVPVEAVRSLGAETVIAVDLIGCGVEFKGMPRTALGMMMQSAMILIGAASRNQHYDADIVIEPQIAHLRPDILANRNELIALGEQAAREKIDQIIKLLQ